MSRPLPDWLSSQQLLLLQSRVAIWQDPAGNWKTHCNHGCFIEGLELFDNKMFKRIGCRDTFARCRDMPWTFNDSYIFISYFHFFLYLFIWTFVAKDQPNGGDGHGPESAASLRGVHWQGQLMVSWIQRTFHDLKSSFKFLQLEKPLWFEVIELLETSSVFSHLFITLLGTFLTAWSSLTENEELQQNPCTQ